MKTKKLTTWNILLVALGCFLLITTSSNGMFGEEFDKAKADEAAKAKAQQQAEQQQRERELTDPASEASGAVAVRREVLGDGRGPSEKPPEKIQQEESTRIISKSYFSSLTQQEEDELVNEVNSGLRKMERVAKETGRVLTRESYISRASHLVAKKANVPPPATVAEAVAAYHQAVTELGRSLGLEGRPSEEVVEISSRLRAYENSMNGDDVITVQQRALIISQVAADIDARKAAALAQQQSAPQAAAASAAVASTIPHLASSAPEQFPTRVPEQFSRENRKESQFEKEKAATLQNLQDQIAAARARLATHEAKKNDLTKQFDAHRRKVDALQKEVDDFKEGKLLYNLSSALADLRSKRDAALIEKKRFESQTRLEFEKAKDAINVLTSHLRSLGQQHEQVAASVEPVPQGSSAAIHQARPLQGAEFERDKNTRLANLQWQIDALKPEHDFHWQTMIKLGAERQIIQENLDRANSRIRYFQEAYPLTFPFSKTMFDYNQNLEKAKLAKREFDDTKARQLEAAKAAYKSLSPRLSALQQEHARIAATEDPLIIEQRRREKAAANEMRRQQEAEEGRIAGLAQRKAIEAQLAAERKAANLPPSTPPGSDRKISGDSSAPEQPARQLSTGSHSDGSTSGEEGSHHSTPEKALLPAAAAAALSEADLLRKKIDEVHQEVGRAREFLISARENLFLLKGTEYLNLKKSFLSTWDRYFDLAEQRRQLQQQLNKQASESNFNKAADLFSNYKELFLNKISFKDNCKESFVKDLEDLYSKHGLIIYNMHEDWREDSSFNLNDIKTAYLQNNTNELQELEEPLSKRLKQVDAHHTLKLLQAELALLAPEERPPLLDEIEKCVWQNMPGFSDEDRIAALGAAWSRHARTRLEVAREQSHPTIYYTKEQAAKDWWKNEGQAEMLRRQQESTRLQQNATWNAQQMSMAIGARNMGGSYNPSFRW